MWRRSVQTCYTQSSGGSDPEGDLALGAFFLKKIKNSACSGQAAALRAQQTSARPHYKTTQCDAIRQANETDQPPNRCRLPWTWLSLIIEELGVIMLKTSVYTFSSGSSFCSFSASPPWGAVTVPSSAAPSALAMPSPESSSSSPLS